PVRQRNRRHRQHGRPARSSGQAPRLQERQGQLRRGRAAAARADRGAPHPRDHRARHADRRGHRRAAHLSPPEGRSGLSRGRLRARHQRRCAQLFARRRGNGRRARAIPPSRRRMAGTCHRRALARLLERQRNDQRADPGRPQITSVRCRAGAARGQPVRRPV
ncbi:hypothetical protein LTR94_032542, partial [Friedmanniomyces endolithicus]